MPEVVPGSGTQGINAERCDVARVPTPPASSYQPPSHYCVDITSDISSCALHDISELFLCSVRSHLVFRSLAAPIGADAGTGTSREIGADTSEDVGSGAVVPPDCSNKVT